VDEDMQWMHSTSN